MLYYTLQGQHTMKAKADSRKSGEKGQWRLDNSCVMRLKVEKAVKLFRMRLNRSNERRIGLGRTQ